MTCRSASRKKRLIRRCPSKSPTYRTCSSSPMPCRPNPVRKRATNSRYRKCMNGCKTRIHGSAKTDARPAATGKARSVTPSARAASSARCLAAATSQARASFTRSPRATWPRHSRRRPSRLRLIPLPPLRPHAPIPSQRPPRPQQRPRRPSPHQRPPCPAFPSWSACLRRMRQRRPKPPARWSRFSKHRRLRTIRASSTSVRACLVIYRRTSYGTSKDSAPNRHSRCSSRTW